MSVDYNGLYQSDTDKTLDPVDMRIIPIRGVKVEIIKSSDIALSHHLAQALFLLNLFRCANWYIYFFSPSSQFLSVTYFPTVINNAQYGDVAFCYLS